MHLAPSRPEPRLVEILEELLDDAKAGKFIDICFILGYGFIDRIKEHN